MKIINDRRLTMDEVIAITKEVMLNKSPLSYGGTAVDEFLELLKKDLELAKRKGWAIDLENEIPDFSEK